MTACLTLHIESDDGAAPAAMCGICHRFETSLVSTDTPDDVLTLFLLTRNILR